VPVEDFDDDAGTVQHLRAGGAFQVADLAGRQLVIDDDEFRPAGGCGDGIRPIQSGLGRLDRRGRAFESLPGLGSRGWRHRADHPGATGQRRQFRQLAAAQQRPGAGAIALLRHGADHLVAQRLHQASKFLKAGFVRDLIDVRRLDANEDGERNWRFGLHGGSRSTVTPGRSHASERAAIRRNVPNAPARHHPPFAQ
jgi:hypothetical protein